MKKGSPAFAMYFGTEDLKKMGKSLLIALAGAGVAWLSTTFIPSLSGDHTLEAMLLTAAATWLVNTGRIWITDTTKEEPLL